ncbi:asparagine synthase-related protein [Flexithrix dorotheae]|uniref:asparagine synthase-related protein n=1 Tax=Flexithrix dorotheae TaxID=70993 RepID=UPI00037713C9|nr:asparagine synthase-related protein [Flexithrix dorotheae]
MAKGIWLISRETLPLSIKDKLLEICTAISPDNITPNPPKIEVNNFRAYAVVNPYSSMLTTKSGLLLGKIFNQNEKWDIPCEAYPDGSFALFRDGDKFSEVVSDPAASRTIWYYIDQHMFVASTSQRAIVLLVGTFEFDKRVIPWILSTGSLGPLYSWDKRIKRIPSDSSIILDKEKWEITVKSNLIEFKESKVSAQIHETTFISTINSIFKKIKFNYSNWVVPLSGGFDSRAILCLFKKNQELDNIKTITWGLKAALKDSNNDVVIAKRLANALNVSHEFLSTDISNEPIEIIFHRFFQNGEGRVDHISGYMDGFNIWKSLFENRIEGIIRGDINFCSSTVSTPQELRFSLGLAFCSDFSNLKDYADYQGFEQELPANFLRKNNESLLQWRDRLYLEYRISTILAALSDLKLSYVELVNPLLSKEILELVRTLPDHLRNEKRIFKKMVNSISPNIPYASEGGGAKAADILRENRIQSLLLQEISTKHAYELLPSDLLDTIQENLKASKNGESGKLKTPYKSLLRKIIPKSFRKRIKTKIQSSQSVDYNILAFRVYMIIKMYKLLSKIN